MLTTFTACGAVAAKDKDYKGGTGPDLTAAIDLVEEVARVVGYDTIPSRGPAMGTGVGRSEHDRLQRQVRRRPAELGLTEVLIVLLKVVVTFAGVGRKKLAPRYVHLERA